MPMQEAKEAVVIAYGQTFSSPEGQIVLEDLRKCYQRRCSMDDNSHMLAFREGQRSVVLAIEALMEEAGVVMDSRISGKSTVALEVETPNPNEYQGWTWEETHVEPNP
jgi:hypothetical protein